MQPGASIVIVTFNSAETIADCLNTVYASMRTSDEVFLIDNNSKDNTLAVLKDIVAPDQNNIHILPQKSNLGFAKACNLGIEKSQREFVILLNPDTQVFGDWIQRLLNHFDYYPKTGAVGPLSNQCLSSQQIATYLPNYSQYTHDMASLLAVLKEVFGQKSLPKKLLMGFCIAVPMKILRELGSLDEDIFLGDEDMELSWRLREHGYFLRVALDVYINHMRHTSFKTLPQKTAKEFIQQGTDILFEKMQKYYAPQKVPHPKIYFNIDWWRPSILDYKTENEVFNSHLLGCQYSEIVPKAQEFLRNKKIAEARTLLEDALKIIVDDYAMWYILGSIYLLEKKSEKAEIALKNASAYEFSPGKAHQKLKKLFSDQRINRQAMEFSGESTAC